MPCRCRIGIHLNLPLLLAAPEPSTVGSCAHHYCDVIMGSIASQTASLAIVYSSVYSSPDQREHQSSASLAFVRGIHRRPVNSPHKGPVTRKMFPFNDVIMTRWCWQYAVGARSQFPWMLHPSIKLWPLLFPSNRRETSITERPNLLHASPCMKKINIYERRDGDNTP